MKLKELLSNMEYASVPERFGDMEIQDIVSDSREVCPRSLFVALRGPESDGADFIEEAVARGCRVVVVRTSEKIRPGNPGICVLKVPDTKEFLAGLLSRFYHDPAGQVALWGVTGTNGKTTVSFLLESILNKASHKCAVLGTVSYRIAGRVIKPKNTTPGLVDIYRYLDEMRKEAVDSCVMEVSSHALEQGRVVVEDFRTAVFTNLTTDHLDYHGTMENYFAAKARLFVRLPRSSLAVINRDDVYGGKLTAMVKSRLVTYGIEQQADVQAQDIRLSLEGSVFKIRGPHGTTEIRTPLIGRHNIYNILAAWGACCRCEIPADIIKAGVESLKVVPGRLERIDAGQDFFVFVDYAHTDDALKNVLTSLKAVSRARVIVVFGCGGDRDRTKRPKMGQVAGELADCAIVTTDNPRGELPQAIVTDIIAGFGRRNYEVILDRKTAVEKALNLASRGDIVLLAGKGHENYQILKDRTIHLDDRETAKSYLQSHF